MNAAATQTAESKCIVEEMYAAGARNDFEGVMKCMDKDVVVIEPPYLPYGGTYKGIGEFQRLLGIITAYADLSTVRLQYAVAEGDRVMAVLNILDKGTGKDLHLAEQSTVRNGKVVEMKIFYFDAGSMIAAGLKSKS